MNELDYGSLEACQRLVEAGIVLETDYCWAKTIEGDYMLTSRHHQEFSWNRVPAPSMAEAWRELPDFIDTIEFGRCTPLIHRYSKNTIAGYGVMQLGRTENVNPTDALIDLIIWLEKRKGES
jgi:hypothetical protein